MTILETSRQFSTTDLYALTKDPLVEKLSDHTGEKLEVTGYCLFEDPDKKTGELMTLLSLELAEGAPVATNSPTVQRSFKDIIEIYRATGNENPYPFTVEVFSKKAIASGRPYLNIRLVDEAY